jgi:hypothetical protein
MENKKKERKKKEKKRGERLCVLYLSENKQRPVPLTE